MIFKEKKRALEFAADLTVVLLAGPVSVLFDRLFHTHFGFYLLLGLFLVSIGVLGNIQYRIKGAIDSHKLIRTIWRLGFLFLSFFYILFMFIELAKLFVLALL